MGLEPTATTLATSCSTTELRPLDLPPKPYYCGKCPPMQASSQSADYGVQSADCGINGAGFRRPPSPASFPRRRESHSQRKRRAQSLEECPCNTLPVAL